MTQLSSKASSIVLGCPWSSKVIHTSNDSDCKEIVLETHASTPEEHQPKAMELHVISVLANASSRFERKDGIGRWVHYIKTSESITLTPAGAVADFILRSPAEFIHVGLDRKLIDRTLEEMDDRPRQPPSERIGLRDRTMFQLIALLKDTLEADIPSDRLYIDALATALAVRYLTTEQRSPCRTSRVQPLPKRVLERVREKMQASLTSNLSLRALAQEAGYSSGHFLRMFQAATGSTPHHFFLTLRLEHARDLLAHNRGLSIVNVASTCGFSTQSHFTSMFRHRFGVTPAQFRRALNGRLKMLPDVITLL
jgi:AraC family transcriptional regulator